MRPFQLPYSYIDTGLSNYSFAMRQGDNDFFDGSLAVADLATITFALWQGLVMRDLREMGNIF